MNLQAISSYANNLPLQLPPKVQGLNLSKADAEVLTYSGREPVISPEKIVELLSLMMSTPDIIRNKTGNLINIRA
ncbi:MAG: hypothetical protein EBS19_03305 [Spirochaetia bacterium]|nr:hypothetical protein [Spirochaetia bacterium]